MNQATAISEAPASSADAGAYRPPYVAAAIAALAVWLLYAITLAPTTAFWDTSEYIATAHILGIPHPPGNPTFVVLARAWDAILSLFGLSTAVRINLFSATMSALAHGFWFLLVHRIMAFYTDRRSFRMVGASMAVLLSATAFTVWNQSVVNEKVYTVSLFTIALLSWLAFHWRDNLGKGKDDNLLLLAIYVLALSVGNHLMAFLAAPAFFVFILLVHPRTVTNWKLYAVGAALAIIGLSIHVFLPLRASLSPVINEANPSTLHALWESLTRQQYDKPSMFSDPTDPSLPRTASMIWAQIVNYVQYFDWQWARSVAGKINYFGSPRPLFTLAFAVLGGYGAFTHFKKDRISFYYVAVLFLTLSLGLVAYLNFKYGFSTPFHPDSMEMHEVRERDYFFVVGFSVWGLWAGLGLTVLWMRLSEELAGRFRTLRSRQLVAAPLLAIGLLPLVLNWTWASRAKDYTARDWAYNLLMSVKPYSVLFTNGDNDTFPLWYLQEVEGIRRDVIVIVMSYLNTGWYAKQLKQLSAPCPPGVDPLKHADVIVCQRPFQPEKDAEFYAKPGLDIKKPTRSILSMSDQQIDSIPLIYMSNPYQFALQKPFQFKADSLSVTIPGNRILLPSDVFMVNILRTAMGDRPVYYATTTQAYNRFGLDNDLIRQGVAFELSDGPVPAQTDTNIVALPSRYGGLTGRFLDYPRTRRLMDSVFVHQSPGIPTGWTKWVDMSTENIPAYYGYTFYALTMGASLRGDTIQAKQFADSADAWLRLSRRQ